MPYTMKDFKLDLFAKLTLQEQREALERLPPERRRKLLQPLLQERLAGLSEEEIRELLDQRAAGHVARPRKRRKK